MEVTNESLSAGLEEVTIASKIPQKIINEMVNKRTIDLDKLVVEVLQYLDYIRDAVESGKASRYSDQALEDHLGRIAGYMYFLNDQTEEAALQSTIADLLYKEMYNQKHGEASGTIPDKARHAELASLNQSLVKEIQERVYKKLKGRMEMADKLLSSLSRIVTIRKMNLEAFKKDPRSRGREDD